MFGDSVDIVTITREGQALASVMNFYFRDQVLPYYGGGKAIARGCAANDFMYWEVMRRAADRGYRVFDFGRSPRDGGTFRFKKGWGAEVEELAWLRLDPSGRSLPPATPSAALERMQQWWSRLPPALSRRLGPTLRRFLSR